MTEEKASARPVHPVDRGWAWMIVLGCCISIFMMGGTLRTFGILMEEMTKHFDTTSSVAMLVLAIEGVCYTLTISVGVMLGERFTARRVVMVGAVIGSVGIAVSSLAFNMTFIICTFGIAFGIGNGLLHGNGLVMVSRYFEKRRALANGLAVAGGSLGQLIMPPVIQYLINTYTLTGTLLILGGIYSHLLIAGSLYTPISFYEKRQQRREQSTSQKSNLLVRTENHEVNLEMKPLRVDRAELNTVRFNSAKNIDEHEGNFESSDKQPIKATERNKLVNKQLEKLKVPGLTGSRHSLSPYASMEDIVSASMVSLSHIGEEPGETTTGSPSKSKLSKCWSSFSKLSTLFDFSMLKKPPFVYYVVASLFCFVGFFNVIFFIPSYAVKRGVEKYNTALLISIIGICDLVGRISMGWFADLNLVQRYKIVLVMVMLNGVNSLLLPLANRYWWIALHCGLYGLSGGAYVPLFPVITVDFFGLELLPKALAVLLLIMGAAAAVMQPILGWMADRAGSFDVVFYTSGGVAMVGSVLCIFLPVAIKNKHDKPSEQEKTVEQDGVTSLLTDA